MVVSFNEDSGFTLIEVLISITILMIIGAFLFNSFSFTVHTNANSKNLTIAASLAQEEMERIKSLNWDEIMDIEKSDIDPENYPGYQKKVEITDQSDPLLKKVVVSIYWENQNLELTTLLSHN